MYRPLGVQVNKTDHWKVMQTTWYPVKAHQNKGKLLLDRLYSVQLNKMAQINYAHTTSWLFRCDGMDQGTITYGWTTRYPGKTEWEGKNIYGLSMQYMDKTEWTKGRILMD